ncbi:hypothetical protein [Actinoplanes sp. G11-F43]|uniref:hypothetical protein n=1 Tax=Actinoplanes sp. G11-F43 TaxID=3424130 RepID=UPI003D341417
MSGPDDPHGLIDETDLAILAEMAALYTAADPVPDGLVERIQFVLALDDLDAEVLRLTGQTTVAAGARGEGGRIHTYEIGGLGLTVRIAGLGPGAVRIDGWLAPPAAYRVVLKSGDQLLHRVADPDGRFVFERAPTGPARIFIRFLAGETALATPELVL